MIFTAGLKPITSKKGPILMKIGKKNLDQMENLC